MLRLALAIAIALLTAVAGGVAGWAHHQQPAVAFHHMRYCAAPGGFLPMRPCAEIDDPTEVVPL